MNALPDVTHAYSSIIQEEKQRHLGTTRDTIETSAMVVEKNEPTTLIVRRKQVPASHFNSSNRKPLHCSHCDRDHHIKETYWKLHGYPPKHLRHGVTRNVYSKPNVNSQFSANNVTASPVMQQFQSIMNGLTELQL